VYGFDDGAARGRKAAAAVLKVFLGHLPGLFAWGRVLRKESMQERRD